VVALLSLALGLLIGRQSAPAPVPDPLAPPEAPVECPTVTSATVTSTAGLCPCPPPPRSARLRPTVARVRSPLPPPRSPAPRGDPTLEVVQYLRAEASRFGACAPPAGDALHLHLELTVRPDGSMESVRIANLDPVPPAIASCVEQEARRLSPPPFSSAVAEVFALTLVL